MKTEKGFTLIEVLVAVAVFAVLVSTAHLGLSSLISQNDELQARGKQFARLNNVLHLLEIDLLQALPRISRDKLGGVVPAFVVRREQGLKFEFAQAGTGRQMESGVARIQYAYADGELSRAVGKVLDGDIASVRTQPFILLGELRGFDIEMLDDARQVHSEWPVSSAGTSAQAKLPAGVRLRLDTLRWGVLERTFLVGG